MREIKFREWNSKVGWWDLPAYLEPCDINECIVRMQVEGYTVQQYTGLKDKNGKEVYEGDIVRAKEAVCVREIEWVDDLCGFNANPSFDYEVIGNIYESPGLLGETPENPELLEKQ